MANKINPDLEYVIFDGKRFARKKGKRYFTANRWDKNLKKYYSDSLHRAVWSKTHGPIPHGTHIHHIDSNWDNNEVGNLECLTRREHMLKHRDKFRTEKHRALLKRLRKKALVGYRSYQKEERYAAECTQRGKTTWSRIKERSFICIVCGCDFKRKTPHPSRFCSRKCKERNRYLRRRACLRCVSDGQA